MSCGCTQNGLTSCGCSDNCPYKTSDITVFDGSFTSIVLPAGAGLNEALEALEEFVLNTVNNLNLVFTVSPSNCLGLAPGEYGYSQMFTAIINALCELNVDVSSLQASITAIEGDITTIQGDITTIQGDITDIETTITTEFGDNMPIGAMMMYPVAVPPNSKWLICEGQSLSTAAYPELFALVQYDFGGGGASFSLPDLRAKFIAGYDNSQVDYGTIGSGAGSNTVALTKSEIPQHKHTVNTSTTDGGIITVAGGSHDHTMNYRDLDATFGGGTTMISDSASPTGTTGGVISPAPSGSHVHVIDGNTGDGTTDGLNGLAHENRPEFVVFPWIIKALP